MSSRKAGFPVWEIRVWDTATHREVARFEHDSSAEFPTFSPDGNLLFAYHTGVPQTGQSISINEISTSREIGRLYWNGSPVDSIAASPAGDILATGHQDGKLSLWDISTRSLIATWPVGDQSVSALTFTPDGRVLISAAGPTIKLWDLTYIRRELAAIGLDW